MPSTFSISPISSSLMRKSAAPIFMNGMAAMGERADHNGVRIDGKQYFSICFLMKTTIDIPEALYKKAKIRAVEQSWTLRELVLAALERELESTPKAAESEASLWASRKLLPAYEAALKEGAFSRGMDSTRIISEERDAR
jgi:hypothetical protein